jgi:hypothetical protein
MNARASEARASDARGVRGRLRGRRGARLRLTSEVVGSKNVGAVATKIGAEKAGEPPTSENKRQNRPRRRGLWPGPDAARPCRPGARRARARRARGAQTTGPSLRAEKMPQAKTFLLRWMSTRSVSELTQFWR